MKNRLKILTYLSLVIFLFQLSTSESFAFILDDSYGSSGLINTNVLIGNTLGKSFAIQSDGKLLVGGFMFSSNYTNSVLARYSSTGLADSSFGTSGYRQLDLGEGSALDSGITVQTDNKIVATGSIAVNGKGAILQGRLNANGSIDNSYGTNGFSKIVINNANYVIKFHNLLSNQNKTFVIGYIGNGNGAIEQGFIAKLNATGSLDSGFGTNGVSIFHLPSDQYDHFYSGAVQADGKIITAGTSSDTVTDKLMVNRFNSDGSIDTSFGNNGTIIETLGSRSPGRDVKIQQNGKIIVVGQIDFDGNNKEAFAIRYNSNGSRDASFANGGIYEGPKNSVSSANSVVIQADGKIILGGAQPINSGSGFGLIRLNSDGTIDSEYGNTGVLITDVGISSATVVDMQLYDGDLFVGGGSDGGNWVAAKYVDEANKLLQVPLLKQTDPAWKKQPYDTANIWNPSDSSIGSWGCALTSAAMVFNFHGIKKLPDGKTLNPGTLNDWLKKQKDGYVGNGFLNWLSLTRLSKQAKSINAVTNFDALEFKKITPGNTNSVKNDVVKHVPDILEEPGHFVVATGTQNNDIKINDPFYSRTSLTSYGNGMISLNKFTPSHTDLSYIMIAFNPTLNVDLRDSNNNSVGQVFTENPINNPNTDNQNNGNPIKILYLEKPADTSYHIIINSSSTTSYSLAVYLYDKDGDVFEENKMGIITASQQKNLPVTYTSQNLYPTTVTFTTLQNDVAKAFKNKQLTNDLYATLTTKEVLAKKDAGAGKVESELSILLAMEKEIEKNNGTKIKDPAYSKLLYDLNYLETHL